MSGKAIFGEVCAACHASSQFNGLVRIWAGRTVHDLFESIRNTMPYDGPGRLSAGEYADLVAYILTLNGLPPGDEPLAGDAGLKRIRIEVGGERGS
ncbi:MAG: hypothetical protein GWN02_02705 [Gemmatimonadetes bacterium]|nr:hypothetical protein [Gemmatimonadota bacterium]